MVHVVHVFHPSCIHGLQQDGSCPFPHQSSVFKRTFNALVSLNQRLCKAAGEFGQLAACKIEAQRIVESMELSERDSRLLCWNLLALANTDGLDERETDFIRFVVRKANVDEATFEELRNYSDAIVEIEQARKALGTSDRSYSKIEPLMTEYAHREQIILGAAQALVCD
jgi:hypothetical protein